MANIPLGWVPQPDGSYSPPSKTTKPQEGVPFDREEPLHLKIINHCDSQYPRWKYIRARMDKRSTISVGAQDFTIFLPGGKTLCVECKAKNGKLDSDQLIWKKEMEMLGHTVHTVWSFEDFLSLL